MRFSDEVLQAAMDAFTEARWALPRTEGYAAMRAVLEGHETDRVVALERMIERLRGALDLCATDEEGWPEIECADAYEASRVLVPASDGSPRADQA